MIGIQLDAQIRSERTVHRRQAAPRSQARQPSTVLPSPWRLSDFDFSAQPSVNGKLVDGYPSKAEHSKVVLTWNYLVAHVYGLLVVHGDIAWLESLLRRLTARHEEGRDVPWLVDDAPASFVAAQLRAIVGVELVIERVEAKAKWSQNRSIGRPHRRCGRPVRGGSSAPHRAPACATNRSPGRRDRGVRRAR